MGVKNNLSTNGFYKRMFHNMHTTFDDHHQIRKRAAQAGLQMFVNACKTYLLSRPELLVGSFVHLLAANIKITRIRYWQM